MFFAIILVIFFIEEKRAMLLFRNTLDESGATTLYPPFVMALVKKKVL